MSLCIKNVQKREKQNFGFFDKLPYLHGIWETVCRTKKIIKQKMQGAGSFVGIKLSKIKALSLTVKKLWLKNLKNEYP